MNNFKTIVSVAVLVSMASLAQAADITADSGAILATTTSAGSAAVSAADVAAVSVTGVMANATEAASTVGVEGILGEDTVDVSTVTLPDAVLNLVVSYSASGINTSQSLTQVHDTADTASVVAASALQVSTNTHGGAVTADGTMADLTVAGAALDKVIYSVSATGAGGTQSVTPDLIR